jgi:dimethylamine monooxygenase subunit C
VLVTGIKSKPVYAPLRADVRGRYHLMLGLGAGEVALLRVLREMQASAAEALSRTRVFLTGTPADGAAGSSRRDIEDLPLQEIRLFSETPALLGEFKSLLADSLMGTRLYVAGPESFIGLAMKLALEFNLNKDEIRAEEMGTLARRVYCIHCRTTTENVRTNIVRCQGCERWLLVRDHYSRRLAAYMGVMVDAEVPGELPPIKEVFV